MADMCYNLLSLLFVSRYRGPVQLSVHANPNDVSSDDILVAASMFVAGLFLIDVTPRVSTSSFRQACFDPKLNQYIEKAAVTNSTRSTTKLDLTEKRHFEGGSFAAESGAMIQKVPELAFTKAVLEGVNYLLDTVTIKPFLKPNGDLVFKHYDIDEVYGGETSHLKAQVRDL